MRPTDRNQDRSDGGVRVITRAARILQALKAHPEGLNLSELAREVGLARTTVHRVAAALVAERFVTEVPAGGLQLGPALVGLGAAVNRDLRSALRPLLGGLSIEVNETVTLVIQYGDELRIVEQITAPNVLQVVPGGIGQPAPWHTTANGKAILAELPLDEVERLLSGSIPASTPHTITDRARLFNELEHIRATRVAIDREEFAIGICGLGVAVCRPGEQRLSVGIAAPTIRFLGSEERLSEALLRARERICQRLAS